MSALGIDVSSWNPAGATLAGISFTAVKATEGTGYTNPEYGDQVAAARARGNVVIHYHFLHAGDVPGQVARFLAACQLRYGDVLAVDWETPLNSPAASCSERDAFLRALPVAYRRVAYENLDYLHNWDASGYHADGLWVADPDSPAGQPHTQGPWLFHQYGQTGGLDTDCYNGDETALRAWAGAPSTAPPWPGEYLQLQSPMLHDSAVRTWQQRMADRGWPITVDGWYGSQSRAFCLQFQTDSTAHGWPLKVDGIVGAATWRATWDRPVS